MQDDIATAIMDAGLRVRLTSNDASIVRHPTTDGDAYDLFCRPLLPAARHRRGLPLFPGAARGALVRDPKFALAYGARRQLRDDGDRRPRASDRRLATGQPVHAAGRGTDPDLPEALVADTASRFCLIGTGPARNGRERLLALPWRYRSQSLRPLAIEHWALGRPQEALQLARRTRELDPRSANLAILEADYLLRSEQFDAAIALYETPSAPNPEREPLLRSGRARSRQGSSTRPSRRGARRTPSPATTVSRRRLPARGRGRIPRIDEAWVRLQLETLKERERTKYVSPLDFARAYAQLGEKELAFKYLDAAFVDRSPGLVFLKVDRAWDAVRSDPRFAAAIRQVGLP